MAFWEPKKKAMSMIFFFFRITCKFTHDMLASSCTPYTGILRVSIRSLDSQKWTSLGMCSLPTHRELAVSLSDHEWNCFCLVCWESKIDWLFLSLHKREGSALVSGLSPSRPFLSLQLIVTDFSSLRCSLLCVYLFIISSLVVAHWRLKMTKALSVWRQSSSRSVHLKNFCPNALSWLKDHKARRRQSVFHCCVLLAHLSPALLTLSPCGTWPAAPPAI